MPSVALIGGDARFAFLPDMLRRKGFSVRSYGLGRADDSPCLTRALEDASLVVGPIPLCRKDGMLQMPLHDQSMELSELAIQMRNHSQRLLAGVITPKSRKILEDQGIVYADLMDDEAFVSANVVPTVEGAMQLAMERMDMTLEGSHVLVLGYGRIGKLLLKRFSAMGAHVWVCARREESLVQATAMRGVPVAMDELSWALPRMDLILNTVPALLLDETLLGQVNKDTPLMELASAPYGIDMDAARALGLRIYLDSSLPGKVAPRSAAAYILHAVEKNLEAEIAAER